MTKQRDSLKWSFSIDLSIRLPLSIESFHLVWWSCCSISKVVFLLPNDVTRDVREFEKRKTPRDMVATVLSAMLDG